MVNKRADEFRLRRPLLYRLCEVLVLLLLSLSLPRLCGRGEQRKRHHSQPGILASDEKKTHKGSSFPVTDWTWSIHRMGYVMSNRQSKPKVSAYDDLRFKVSIFI
jgi:hypothetical protein